MQNYPIVTLIPQRPPFVMVDKLLNINDNCAITRFAVTADNVLVINGDFTEAGLMENIAQTAAAHAGYTALNNNVPVKAGYIGAVKNLEIVKQPQVGDELLTEIKIENQIFDVTVISGKVMCNGRLLAQCEMKIFITP